MLAVVAVCLYGTGNRPGETHAAVDNGRWAMEISCAQLVNTNTGRLAVDGDFYPPRACIARMCSCPRLLTSDSIRAVTSFRAALETAKRSLIGELSI